MTAPALLNVNGFNTEAAPKIELVFDQNLDASLPPATSCFTVHFNGTTYPVTAVVMAGDQYVDLTVTGPLPVSGSGVTVDYTDPGTTSSIRNGTNEHASSFSGHVIAGGFITSNQATLSHVYEGSSGTVELPTALTGGQYETSASQVRVLIARGVILATGMHIWVYVDGVAYADVAGSITAGTYNDTLTQAVTGLAAGLRYIDVLVIDGSGNVFEGNAGTQTYLIKQADATASGAFLLDNFTGAQATALTTGHTGEIGGTWAVSSQSIVSAGSGTEGHKLHLGTLYNNANPSFAHAYVYPSANPANATFAYEFDVVRAAGTSGYTALATSVKTFFCYDSGTDSYYQFQFNFVTSGASVVLQLAYRVRVNGVDVVNTTLANQAFSAGAHTFRVEVSDVSGWEVRMDGTLLLSGTDYLIPRGSQNLLMQVNSNTTNYLTTLDAVRGYDLAEPPTYPVTSLVAVAFGSNDTIVPQAEGFDAVAFGEPTRVYPTASIRVGIRAITFGKPVGPNAPTCSVHSTAAVKLGYPTAFHLVP